jgi:hypothetical protein
MEMFAPDCASHLQILRQLVIWTLVILRGPRFTGLWKATVAQPISVI